jgi:predicted small lipoprotein YifL
MEDAPVMTKIAKTALIALGLMTALAACGRMGDLAEPGPLEPATVNRPSSQMPIDGGPSNPIGGTAAGREPQ